MLLKLRLRRIATQAFAALSVVTAELVPATAGSRARPEILLSDGALSDGRTLTALLHAAQVAGEVTIACSGTAARAILNSSTQGQLQLPTESRLLLGETRLPKSEVSHFNGVFDAPLRDFDSSAIPLSAILHRKSGGSVLADMKNPGASAVGARRGSPMPAAIRHALFTHLTATSSPGAVTLLDPSGAPTATLASPISTVSATPPMLPGQGNVADHLVEAAARVEAASAAGGPDTSPESHSTLLLPSGPQAHRPASFDDVAAVASRLHVPAAHLQRWRSTVMDAASAGHVDALLAALSGRSLSPPVLRLPAAVGPATSAFEVPAPQDAASHSNDAPAHASKSRHVTVGNSVPADIVAALVQWHDAEHGATPLHAFCASVTAVCDGDELATGLQALLAAGADVNAPAANGSTPLHWAAGAGALEAVRALLSHGADPSARTYTWRRQVFGRGSGQLPIHWAAESGYTDVVKLLAGASLPSVLAQDERGQTPAQAAAKELALSTADELRRLEATPLTLVRIRLGSATARPVDAALLRPAQAAAAKGDELPAKATGTDVIDVATAQLA